MSEQPKSVDPPNNNQQQKLATKVVTKKSVVEPLNSSGPASGVENWPVALPDKSSGIYFLLGVAIGLIPAGMGMIGVTVNIWFGAVLLLAAFCFVVRAFWMWEKSSKWHVVLRTITVLVAATAYCFLIGMQMLAQYRKDHPTTVATTTPKTSETSEPANIPTPSTFSPSNVKPSSKREEIDTTFGELRADIGLATGKVDPTFDGCPHPGVMCLSEKGISGKTIDIDFNGKRSARIAVQFSTFPDVKGYSSDFSKNNHVRVTTSQEVAL